MATLVSPGVSVTVTDQSYYIPATAPTVPLIILATQENKLQNPTNSNSAIAPGTQEYGVVRTITSLAQSVSTFGVPSFLTTNGQPNHGDCRNEYGLAALNAFLGIGSYAYTIRANVNLDDNFADIQSLWSYDIQVASSILSSLVSQWISQYNQTNNLVGSSVVSTIDQNSLFGLIQSATSFIWNSFTFSGGSPSLETDFFANLDATGLLTSVSVTTAPTSPTNGTYTNVALTTTSGTGSGAVATIVISGGVITSVTITSAGTSYNVGDTLSFSGTGLGTGGQLTVATVSANSFPVYANGFTQPSTGTFIGVTGFMDAWVSQGLGGTVSTQWTASEATQTLMTLADDFEWTQDFQIKTALGADDSARRAVIVEALNSVINSNQDIRSAAVQYNIVLCPGYYECTTSLFSLVTQYLNSEVFVIGDTPMNVGPNTGLPTWASGSGRVVDTAGNVAYYYPHCLTTNLDGSTILLPSSAYALRTYAFSDNVSYQWFAPAGTRRGVMSGLTDLGYVDPGSVLGTATTFDVLHPNQGQRDIMYAYTATGGLNPLVYFPGNGFVVWGQKTSTGSTATALDRVNVSRLVKYIARQLRINTLPFVFEPNDTLTRNNLKTLVDNFLGDLITKRGLYDFATICDTSNNTPQVIDANELIIEVAIQPVKAAEFIYVPITIVATGSNMTAGGAVQPVP
jgi:hypothetical protein